MEFAAGTQVEILVAGKWQGPYTVTALQGRTADHLVLSGPNGRFEQYNDAPFNTRPVVVEDAAQAAIDYALALPTDMAAYQRELRGEGNVIGFA